ncbi:hypothetical protein [Chryseobacterium sp. HR92]|uniref:hypothetical protein n=1 Tax=Chryseobacterium sp. HR92 TaxID=3094839 RepID=UPI00388D3A3B|nr:hypothetical protein SFA27_16895 [Chryseobacterium sp. HR92]
MAKLTAQSETKFNSTDKPLKKKITLEFVRFGRKGGKNTKEYFRVATESGIIQGRTLYITLEDLKRIVVDAELLIKAADGEL